MPIRFVPPFLKKLASDRSPLIDDHEIQAEIAREKARAEREDRDLRGELFHAPMREEVQQAPLSMPFPELNATGPDPSRGRMERPIAPPALSDVAPESPRPSPVPEATLPMPPQSDFLSGPIIPPGAPPPPPPADRPPGSFRFDSPVKKPDVV